MRGPCVHSSSSGSDGAEFESHDVCAAEAFGRQARGLSDTPKAAIRARVHRRVGAALAAGSASLESLRGRLVADCVSARPLLCFVRLTTATLQSLNSASAVEDAPMEAAAASE